MNRSRLAAAACVLVLLLGLWQVVFKPAYSAQLGNRSLQLSTAQTNAANTAYRLAFNFATTGTLGSVEVEFCSNDPFPGTPCTVPIGFDASGAVLDSQTGPGGFVIDPASTSNKILLSRAPSMASAGAASYQFSGFTNPSDPGSYYVRLQTF